MVVSIFGISIWDRGPVTSPSRSTIPRRTARFRFTDHVTIIQLRVTYLQTVVMSVDSAYCSTELELVSRTVYVVYWTAHTADTGSGFSIYRTGGASRDSSRSASLFVGSVSGSSSAATAARAPRRPAPAPCPPGPL